MDIFVCVDVGSTMPRDKIEGELERVLSGGQLPDLSLRSARQHDRSDRRTGASDRIRTRMASYTTNAWHTKVKRNSRSCTMYAGGGVQTDANGLYPSRVRRRSSGSARQMNSKME